MKNPQNMTTLEIKDDRRGRRARLERAGVRVL